MTDAFEWDESKAEFNFNKHGIDFETAAEVFRDVFAVEDIDASMDYGETRFRITGRAGGGWWW